MNVEISVEQQALGQHPHAHHTLQGTRGGLVIVLLLPILLLFGLRLLLHLLLVRLHGVGAVTEEGDSGEMRLIGVHNICLDISYTNEALNRIKVKILLKLFFEFLPHIAAKLGNTKSLANNGKLLKRIS